MVIYYLFICNLYISFQELKNLGVIYGESGKELKLESVEIFRSGNVMLIGGDETIYTCEYVSGYNRIINIMSKQSFTMEGGTLKYGNMNTESLDTLCYFSIIKGDGGYIHLRRIRLKFVSEMNSFIFMEGGTVWIECLKMENELVGWVYPLVDVRCITSVIVKLTSLNITNCYYKNLHTQKSAVVFFDELYGFLHPTYLNISSLFSQNNTFYMRPLCAGAIFFIISHHFGSSFSIFCF
jgi:hypothetical protein